jgi:hypothetical protein
MPTVTVQLAIPADELLRFYAGQAHVVSARAVDGRTVQFPARILRRFVTEDGITGTFQLVFGDDHKFRDIRRVSSPGRILRRA